MRFPRTSSLAALALLVMGLALLSVPFGATYGAHRLDQNLLARMELFTREWQHNDKRSHGGDGLGPVFNAHSCVACHQLGGTGGGGLKKNNATLISVFVPAAPTSINGTLVDVLPWDNHLKQPNRTKLAEEIHPALLKESSFPLPRFSDDRDYAKWRAGLLTTSNLFSEGKPLTEEKLNELGDGIDIRRPIGDVVIAMIFSHRNAPALFGAGEIDRIPDRVLTEVAAEQVRAAGDVIRDRPQGLQISPRLLQIASEEHEKSGQSGTKVGRNPSLASFVGRMQHALMLPVTGRPARLKDGRIGRFGWKSNVATIREFTLQACATELGLEVPGFHRASPPWKKDYQAPGLDMTAEECEQLVRFVSALPRPTARSPETAQQAAEIAAGKTLFAQVGCAACHRPTLGHIDGIYSDLLLHDMGQHLGSTGSYSTNISVASTDDKDESLPADTGASFPREFNIMLFGKEKPPKFGATPTEWRTPPLWGVRDSGPYLHDGRADTLADAVAFHGGEGLRAANAYFELPLAERCKVDLFLQSLAAPPPRDSPRR